MLNKEQSKQKKRILKTNCQYKCWPCSFLEAIFMLKNVTSLYVAALSVFAVFNCMLVWLGFSTKTLKCQLLSPQTQLEQCRKSGIHVISSWYMYCTNVNGMYDLVSKIILFWRPARYCKCEASLLQVEGLDGYGYILSTLLPALVLNAGRNGRFLQWSIDS